MKTEYSRKVASYMMCVVPSLYAESKIKKVTLNQDGVLTLTIEDCLGRTINISYTKKDIASKDLKEYNKLISSKERLAIYCYIENLYNKLSVKNLLSFSIDSKDHIVCYIDTLAVPQMLDQQIVLLSHRYIHNNK